MHTVVLKKIIKSEFIIEDLAFVNLDNHIDYNSTSEGINATGFISLNGQYYNGGKYAKFDEKIEVDIFVPQEKISSKKAIEIKIKDFDYHIENNQMEFSIKVDIWGLKEDIKTFPSTDNDLQQEKEEILETPDKTDTIFEESKVEEVENITEIQPRIIEKKVTKSKDSTVICWSYKVILKDDTYESISDELKVDSMKLRAINNNKPLKEGMLIKLP